MVGGIVALKAVNPHPMRVAPNPPGAGTRLVVQGVWAYVRHPMYCSILQLALALALFHQAWPLFPMWGALLVCLTAKATYEERLLTAMFPKEYPRYRAASCMLVPVPCCAYKATSRCSSTVTGAHPTTHPLMGVSLVRP